MLPHSFFTFIDLKGDLMEHQFYTITNPEQVYIRLPLMVQQLEYLMCQALRAAHRDQGIAPGEFLSGMLKLGGTGTPDRVVLRSGIVLDIEEDLYGNLDLQTCLKYLCCGGLRILSREGEPWEYATDQDAFFRFFGIPYHYDTVPQRPCRRMLKAGDFSRSMLRLYRILTADTADRYSLSNRRDLSFKVKAVMGVAQPLCDTPWEYQAGSKRLMKALISAYALVGQEELLPDGRRRQWAEALYTKGCRLQRGDGVVRDPEAAVRCYQKAAAVGHPGARLALARCQQLEDGMPWDIPAAIQTYRSLADAGYGPAMRALADCYRKGIGVESDPFQALRLYTQAVQADDLLAVEAIKDLLSDEALLAAFRRKGKASDAAT